MSSSLTSYRRHYAVVLLHVLQLGYNLPLVAARVVLVCVHARFLLGSLLAWTSSGETCRSKSECLTTHHCDRTSYSSPGHSCSARTRQSGPRTWWCLLSRIDTVTAVVWGHSRVGVPTTRLWVVSVIVRRTRGRRREEGGGGVLPGLVAAGVWWPDGWTAGRQEGGVRTTAQHSCPPQHCVQGRHTAPTLGLHCTLCKCTFVCHYLF